MPIRCRILGLLLLVIPAAAHDDSVSFSRLEVGRDSLGVTLRLQALSIVEVLPWLDGDGDLLIDAAEAADRPEELGRYVLDHFRLYAGGAP
ncbi:MAG: hypothetical protein O2816_14410, partial [Planctomycetota bacterium]|nr:hypothetical protein [Planctomycetota bacterium]